MKGIKYMAWGKELVVDAFNCDIELIKDEANIRKFLSTLVEKIDMVAYGDPILKYFGFDDKMGWTAIQLIETSNITCHFSEENKTSYINCFSCKDFNEELVVDLIEEFFKSTSYNTTVLDRI